MTDAGQWRRQGKDGPGKSSLGCTSHPDDDHPDDGPTKRDLFVVYSQLHNCCADCCLPDQPLRVCTDGPQADSIGLATHYQRVSVPIHCMGLEQGQRTLTLNKHPPWSTYCCSMSGGPKGDAAWPGLDGDTSRLMASSSCTIARPWEPSRPSAHRGLATKGTCMPTASTAATAISSVQPAPAACHHM